jgi:protein-tyrosine kinase
MTKIYQALEQANREQFSENRAIEAVLPVRDQIPPPSPETASRVEGLYHAVCTALPGDGCRVVEFVSPHAGAGVTTLLAEFARTAEKTSNGSVLVLDANTGPQSVCSGFGLIPGIGIHEAVRDGRPLDDALVQHGKSNLFGAVVTREAGSAAQLDAPAFRNAVHSLRDRFDFILVEAPPALESALAYAMGSICDGVVLLVEAEKTRWQVAESVAENLKKNGGNVLGVVLNKRRYHVPGFIYKHL